MRNAHGGRIKPGLGFVEGFVEDGNPDPPDAPAGSCPLNDTRRRGAGDTQISPSAVFFLNEPRLPRALIASTSLASSLAACQLLMSKDELRSGLPSDTHDFGRS